MTYDADWADRRLKQALDDPTPQDRQSIRKLLEAIAVIGERHDHDGCTICKRPTSQREPRHLVKARLIARAILVSRHPDASARSPRSQFPDEYERLVGRIADVLK